MDTENYSEGDISRYPYKQKFVNVSFAKGADLYATGGKADRGKGQD